MTRYERVLGPEDFHTLMSLQSLSLCYSAQGRYEDGAKLQKQVLEIRSRTLGEDHPQTLGSMHNLGDGYLKLGRYAEAEQYLHARMGRVDEATRLEEQVLAIRTRTMGEEHPDTLKASIVLALMHLEQDQFGPAEKLLRDVLERQRKALGADDPRTLLTMTRLGRTYLGMEEYAKARDVLRESQELDAGQDLPARRRGLAEVRLGTALLQLEEYEEAKQLLVSGHDAMQSDRDRVPATARKYIAEAALALARLYETLDRPEKAALWLAKGNEGIEEGSDQPE